MMDFGINGSVNVSNVWKSFFQCLETLLCFFPRFGNFFSNVWKSNTPILQHSGVPSRKAGLTLIEVLLAVVILGVGSGVLMLATARCMAVVVKARHYSTAQRLILQVNAENPITQETVQNGGTKSGDFDDEPGYRWEREIIEPDDENREGLYTIRTRVTWSDRGRDSFEETFRWFYIKPEESE